MAFLSDKEIITDITGGYVHIIIPDETTDTGFKSYRVKLEDQIPDELSDLTDDSNHRLVTDTEKSTWNAKLASVTTDSTLTGAGTVASPLSVKTNIVKNITLTGNTSSIDITTDNDGNALILTDFDMVFTGEYYANDVGMYMYLNNNSFGSNKYYYHNGKAVQNIITPFIFGRVDTRFTGVMQFRKHASLTSIISTIHSTDHTNGNYILRTNGHTIFVDTGVITDIKIRDCRFKAGTEILIKKL